MKFLADENFPITSVKILRKFKWNVEYIGETFKGGKDIFILEKAVKENLIILTLDRDYGELIFKFKFRPPPAVVYFRLDFVMPEDPAILLIQKVNKENLLLVPFFTVIENHSTRQRKLF